jgi:1-acyl-sn-glycerol-3-phosphate acyltransferase
MALVTVYGLAWFLGLILVWFPRPVRVRCFQLWSHLLVGASGARVEVVGNLDPATPVLLVANHVSYFDMAILMMFHPFAMVCASEMRDAPFVGRMMRALGSIFVERGSLRSARRLVAAATGALRRGESVAAFPEGRIRCSAPGGPFAPAVLQAAVDTGVPVRPVLMWWELPDGRPTSHASWLNGELLGQSLRRVQQWRGLRVKVQVLADLDPATAGGRKELALRARASISAASREFPVTCLDGRAAVATQAVCP